MCPSTDENEWRIDHTLQLSDYGTGGHGSWVLLSATRPASPIFDYDRGLYKTYAAGKAVWLRSSSVLHYTREELAAARAAKEERRADESQQAAEEEVDTTGFTPGERLYAKGFDGRAQAWYVAEVMAVRQRFPPLQIRYLATHPDGEASALALPVPRVAFVPTTHVQRHEPSDLA